MQNTPIINLNVTIKSPTHPNDRTPLAGNLCKTGSAQWPSIRCLPNRHCLPQLLRPLLLLLLLLLRLSASGRWIHRRSPLHGSPIAWETRLPLRPPQTCSFRSAESPNLRRRKQRMDQSVNNMFRVNTKCGLLAH